MANAYRIVRIEPSCRVVKTAAGSGEGTAAASSTSRARTDNCRIVRLEPSYRIVNSEVRHDAEERNSVPFANEGIRQPESKSGTFNDRLLRDMVHKAPDVLLLVSSEGKIVFANATCAELLGYEPEELTGQSIELLVPLDARAGHDRHRASYEANPSRRPMGRNAKLTAAAKDGRQVPVDIAISTMGDGAGSPMYVVAVRDATEQQALVRSLETLATTDPLTGVLNRRSFYTAGLREFERFHRLGSPLSLMILDIDHFKVINDTYGHDVGDKALVQLSSNCLAQLRRTDVMARLGGEEFAILIPGYKPKEAIILAERVREKVSRIQTPVDGKVVSFTVSIGLSEAKAGDQSISDALKRADLALYNAKRNGRNKVVIDESAEASSSTVPEGNLPPDALNLA